jgi:hypothetical protein
MIKKFKENPPELDDNWGDRSTPEELFTSLPSSEEQLYCLNYASVLSSLTNPDILWDVLFVNTFLRLLLATVIFPKEVQVYIHPTVILLNQQQGEDGKWIFDKSSLEALDSHVEEIKRSEVAYVFVISRSKKSEDGQANHIGLLTVNNNPKKYKLTNGHKDYGKTLTLTDFYGSFDDDIRKEILNAIAGRWFDDSSLIPWFSGERQFAERKEICLMYVKKKNDSSTSTACASLTLNEMLEELEKKFKVDTFKPNVRNVKLRGPKEKIVIWMFLLQGKYSKKRVASAINGLLSRSLSFNIDT